MSGRIMAAALALLFVAACAAPAGANLLTNGGFETGSLAGWTLWNATWSSGYAAAADPIAEYSGGYGLKLNITGSASFGVYQQVGVTPGQAYRLDGMWKGASGAGNWFEIILIDGPFNIDAADSAPGVFQNVVTGYDSHPAFNYPAPWTFGWQSFASTYNQEVSDYIANGVRTASGSVMTVVLKIGSYNNTNKPTAYFDDVSLTLVPEPASLLAVAVGTAMLIGRRKRRC